MRVVVAVPVYRRDLLRDEEISLEHLEQVLGRYERVFVMPESLDFERQGYGRERFPDSFFTGVASYSRLLLDPAFYRRFAAYDVLLIYQLDCLVFKDELQPFCELGFDYLGAPWPRFQQQPERGLGRVGNGGLSLRRVASCLRVLDAERRRPRFPIVLARLLGRRSEGLSLRRKLRVAREVARGIGWYRRAYTLNEDLFWADRAPLFDPRFRVADVATGLSFSFDQAPRFCFRQNGRRLPFGCHGWFRHDREFWAEHLLSRDRSPAPPER